MFGLNPLTPAYGRDYKAKAAIESDFKADKDFMTPSGRYTNRADLVNMGIKQVTIRYAKLQKVAVLAV